MLTCRVSCMFNNIIDCVQYMDANSYKCTNAHLLHEMQFEKCCYGTQNSFNSFPTLEQYFLEKCSCRTSSVPSEPSPHLFFIVQLWVMLTISYQRNVIDIHYSHLEKCELFLLFVPNTVYRMKLSFLLHHWFCNRNYELSLTLSYSTWPFLLQIANYWTLIKYYVWQLHVSNFSL